MLALYPALYPAITKQCRMPVVHPVESPLRFTPTKMTVVSGPGRPSSNGSQGFGQSG